MEIDEIGKIFRLLGMSIFNLVICGGIICPKIIKFASVVKSVVIVNYYGLI